jgi:hypothetical protein
MSAHDDDPGPGGGERRRLDRAPGERYGQGAADSGAADGVELGSGPAVPPRAAAIAATVALAGALAFFVLGQLDLGPGLLAVAAFAGWITAIALVGAGVGGAGVGGARGGGGETGHRGRTRIAGAAVLAGGAIALAIGLDWAWATVQAGVLGPLDYVAQRYGPAAIADIGVAGAVAALRAR